MNLIETKITGDTSPGLVAIHRLTHLPIRFDHVVIK